MNNSELESKLSRFKFKDAAPELRERILNAARLAMQSQYCDNHPRNAKKMVKRWNLWVFYAVAAMFLFLLNGFVTFQNQCEILEMSRSLNLVFTEKTPMEKLYAEFGLNPTMIRIVRITKANSSCEGINAVLRRNHFLMELL